VRPEVDRRLVDAAGLQTGGSPELAAVLWDMDGTLVDTEPYWIEREFEIVAQHGNGGWSMDHGHALVGKDLRDSARYIAEHGAVGLPIDDIVNLLLDGVIERFRREVPWRPGARELLADLGAAGIPCALVTMSWRRFTDALTDVLPAGSFTAVVAGDDVTHGKPHPEPYLTGAARLGVDPRACLALEDSPTGARSAQAAGCVVVAVPHVVAVPREIGHHHLPSLVGLGAAHLRDLHRSGLSTSTRPPLAE
jgi:HAD superfamily hydrolase (TIGR01509 family)